MKIACALGVILLFGGAASLFAEKPTVLLERYTADLRRKYPDVATITPGDLVEAGSKVLLLDVRSREEYNVSRLPGAVWAEGDAVAQLRRIGIQSSRPIVVYCSVGLRSARLARILAQAGYTNVRNLEGSIFGWANEGRDLENDAGATRGCHPFNVIWGRYLERSRWSWKPF